jgi:hypothetical protein
MAETPEELRARLDAQNEKNRLRAAVYQCPVPDCHRYVDEHNVFRLMKDSDHPDLGEVDTYFCPRCSTHLVRDAKGEPWSVEEYPDAE